MERHGVRHVAWGGWAVAVAALCLAILSLGASRLDAARGPTATLQLDRAHAASMTVTATSGGTLRLRGAHGSAIVVRIPAGAVAEDTAITATPLRRFTIRPVRGGFVSGVQLAPEGLELLRPGTVEFVAGRHLSPARRFFLGTGADGRGVHLLPPAWRVVGRGAGARVRVSRRAVVPLLHFSTVEGFDWSSASLADINAVRFPAAGLHALQDRLARELAEEAAGQLKGFDTQVPADRLTEVLDQGWARIIKPHAQVITARLRGDGCSPAALRESAAAQRLVIGYMRQQALLGNPDNAFAVLADLANASAACMLKLCPRYGPRAAPYFLFLSRQMQLLGEIRPNFYDALTENMVRCGKGEVVLDARVTFTRYNLEGGHQVDSVRVTARIPFSFRLPVPGAPPAPPEGPLVHAVVTGTTQQGCVISSLLAGTEGTGAIAELVVTPLDPNKPDTNPPIDHLTLAIPQAPLEVMQIVSGFGGGVCRPDFVTTQDERFWSTLFTSLHPGLVFPGADFLPGSGGLVAQAAYTRALDPAQAVTVPMSGIYVNTIDENTLIEVRATPDPPVPLPPALPDASA